jgi:thiamine kinase-like enzyme
MQSSSLARDAEIEALVGLVPALANRDVSIAPLTGGITNRNYRIDSDAGSYVLRIGGEQSGLLGIDRAAEHECSVAAASVGVGPEVVGFLPEHRLLVTRFVSGRALTPEDMRQPSILERVVEALRRYHGGPAAAGRFSPFDTVRIYYERARNLNVSFPPDFGAALTLLERVERAIKSSDGSCPCHNDLLPANFVDDGQSIWIIDWEYAGIGDRFFDLGNLAANGRFEEAHEHMLLELYFGVVSDEHLRRLRLMRSASDMRESLWGFLQSGISTLEFDFVEYGRDHLQRFLRLSPQRLATAGP